MVVDLTVPLNEATPVYPGDPAVKITLSGTYDTSGYEDHLLSLGTHAGTHMDAPAHMVPGGKTLAQYAPERFVGRGICIPLSAQTVQEVESADIKKGDFVLFKSGMGAKLHESVYFSDYPAISDEVVSLLIDKEVGAVGVDACSVDNLEGFPVHKRLLQADVLIIENLTNLERLPLGPFTIYALPLNLDLDGSPARVMASF